MQAPAFWTSRHFLSTLLLPAAWIYDVVRRLRCWSVSSETLPVPVICVGNLTTGGAGKTPVALAIGNLLKAKNVKAYFLSRGYGGALPGPVLVDSHKHTAGDVGDEPLLLAQLLPTVVAKNRRAGAQFAIAQGAGVIVMDDGLQNPSLVKTLSLAVVDGTLGFGNGRLLPAGPLREPLEPGLQRCDAVIVINSPDDFIIPHAKRIFAAITQPVTAEFVKDKRWLAFCGIAYPHKFFATLHNLGGHVVESRTFSDHHPYIPHEINGLRREATALGAGLITTAKDWVRIPEELRRDIRVLDIVLAFDNAADFETFIMGAAGNA